MTEFDYNNLAVSSFTETEKAMKGGKYEANDLAILSFAIMLVNDYGIDGAIGYCKEHEEWAEYAILTAHKASQSK